MQSQDEQLIIQLTKQLKGIKLILGFFFIMFILILGILGFMTYKVITFTNDVTKQINSFQNQTTETLNLKKQLCSSKTLTAFLENKSEICR